MFEPLSVVGPSVLGVAVERAADDDAGGAVAVDALGDALAAARSAVDDLRLWAVPTSRLRSVLESLEHLVRVAQAAQLAVVGEVAGRGEALVPPGADPAARALQARSRAGDGRVELGRVLGVHPATAARRQATAAYVTGAGLPLQRIAQTGGAGAGLGEGTATGRALAEGRVSAEAADVVAATVLDLSEHYGVEGRAAVERALLEHAPEVPLTTLRFHARGLLARAELAGPDGGDRPGTAEPEGRDLLGRAEERAHRRRELYCSPDLHGTWHLRGRLAPEDGATLMAAVEALAAPEPTTTGGPDLRSAAQRRADALVAIASRVLSAPPGSPAALPSDGGARARVVVTTDLAVLTGAVRGAGLLPDDAPLSAGAVRRLACDAELVPAVLGSRSEPLDVGRAVYAVSPAQRRALVLRDRGCAAPGCRAPAGRCHAQHVQHWADGGATDLANLVLLCGHDHRRTHQGLLEAHVVDGRPVVVRAGEPPPAHPPPPWRARLEELLTDHAVDARGESPPSSTARPGPALHGTGADGCIDASSAGDARPPDDSAGGSGTDGSRRPAPAPERDGGSGVTGDRG